MASFSLRRAVAVVLLSVASFGLCVVGIDDRCEPPERSAAQAHDAVLDDLVADFARAARRVPFELATPRVSFGGTTHAAPLAVLTLAAIVTPGRASPPRRSVPSRSRRKLRVWERDSES